MNFNTGTREYIESIFNGQTPVERENPLKGQSKYFYFKPGQRDDISVSDMETVDVPTADTPNPFLNVASTNPCPSPIQNEIYNKDRSTYSQPYGNTPPPAMQPQSNNSEPQTSLWSKVKDEVMRNATFYPVGYAIGSLHAAKQEMDGVNKKGYDNYAHRLGMAQIGQESNRTPAAYMWGDMLGQVKEMYDLDKKTLQGNNIIDTIDDGMKDLGNNDEGLNWGRNNPDKNPRSWLRNLDYRHNVWIK